MNKKRLDSMYVCMYIFWSLKYNTFMNEKMSTEMLKLVCTSKTRDKKIILDECTLHYLD